MAKDTYWFPHDFEPTSDPKMTSLIGKYGAIGYGIYWRIIEMLHSEESHKLKKKEYIFTAIGMQMLTGVEQVKAVVEYAIMPCELFHDDQDFFWSNRVFRNIERRKEISEIKSIAGKKSAELRAKYRAEHDKQTSTNVEQVSTGVEHVSTKERKGKERRRKEKKDTSVLLTKLKKINNVDTKKNAAPPFFDFDWNFEKEQFLAHSAWVETYLSHNEPLSEQDLTNQRLEFIKHLELGNDQKKCRQMQVHFRNWNKPTIEKIKNLAKPKYISN